MDVAVLGRKDTGRDRMVQSERIADGQQPFPTSRASESPNLRKGRSFLASTLSRARSVSSSVPTTVAVSRGSFAVAFVQGHLDAVTIGHHMVVGHDITVRRDDETGTTRHLFLRRTLSARIGAAEKFKEAVRSRRHAAEHLAEEFLRAGRSRRGTLRTDVDDSRAAFGSQLTELGKAGRLGECAAVNRTRASTAGRKCLILIQGTLLSVCFAEPSAKPVP